MGPPSLPVISVSCLSRCPRTCLPSQISIVVFPSSAARNCILRSDALPASFPVCHASRAFFDRPRNCSKVSRLTFKTAAASALVHCIFASPEMMPMVLSSSVSFGGLPPLFLGCCGFAGFTAFAITNPLLFHNLPSTMGAASRERQRSIGGSSWHGRLVSNGPSTRGTQSLGARYYLLAAPTATRCGKRDVSRVSEQSPHTLGRQSRQRPDRYGPAKLLNLPVTKLINRAEYVARQ